MLRINLPEDVSAAWVWGAGTPRSPNQGLVDASARVVDHWGRPDDAVELELTGRFGVPWDLEVVEHHLRPEEIFGGERFQRPAELRANTFAASDRSVFRARFRLDAEGNLLARRAPAAVSAPSGPQIQPAAEDSAQGADSSSLAPDTLPTDSLAPSDSLAPAPDTVGDTTHATTGPPETVTAPPDSGSASVATPDTTVPDTAAADTTGIGAGSW